MTRQVFFLLDLFRYIDGHKTMRSFLEVMRDRQRGRRPYQAYAGVSGDIPCETTFSHFRARIGHRLYNEIFHRPEMITFNILSYDGTLYSTWSRYKAVHIFATDVMPSPSMMCWKTSGAASFDKIFTTLMVTAMR